MILNFDNFINEAYESRGLEDMLRNKANTFKRRGITYRILRQIYSRGIEAFHEGRKKSGSAREYAWRRVNNFISKGRAWSIYDTDLAEQARNNAKKMQKKKKKK